MSKPDGEKHLAGTITKAAPPGQGSVLGPREIAVIASTGAVDMHDDEVQAEGMTPSRCNVPVFLNHQSDGNNLPIGRAYLRVSGKAVVGTIIFAPEGDSEVADNVCRACKNGTMDAVSIGFSIVKATRRPGGRGVKYEAWICNELSVCGVGANPQARVVQRQLDAAEAARAARCAKVADVERTGRRQRAQELERIGREQESRHRAAEGPPLTRDQRVAKARAVTRTGMTEQERRIADLPSGSLERYEAERAVHASKTAAGLAAKEWNENSTAEVRQAKCREIKRTMREPGW